MIQRVCRAAIALMFAGLAASWAGAQAKPDRLLTFVACPIFRDADAGRKSGCWLVDDPQSGERFDISFGLVKPQLGRAVLVEGLVSSEPSSPCGGSVLTPVRLAVLPDHCQRTQISAEGFPGRPYKSPLEQLRPASEPRTLPGPPYEPRTFSIFFEFGRDFLIYQYAELILEKSMLYAKASQAKQVRVEGFAATDPLWVRDGSLLLARSRALQEEPALARARAQMVAEALRRLGVPASSLDVRWQSAPSPSAELEAGKLPEASKRRVVITITP